MNLFSDRTIPEILYCLCITVLMMPQKLCVESFCMKARKFSESDLKLQMRLDRKQIVTNCFVFCLSRKRKYFFQSCGIALMSKKRGNMLEMGCREFFNNYFICDCFNLCTHTAVWIRML
ncbi:hypothetical protein T09_3444 [Trichinella sp. T9]|nr:hypothetical protein T09_3444 [Trichinella sp. T9]